MPRNCCVPQCSNSVVKGKAEHFHKFPENKKLRQAWIHKLKLGRKPSKTMCVCSEHFKSSDYKLSNYGQFFKGDVYIEIVCLHCHSIEGDKTILKEGSVPSEKIPKTVLERKKGIEPTKKRMTKTSARASIGIDVPDVAMTDVPDVAVTDDMMAEVLVSTDEQNTDVFNTEAIDPNKFVNDLCAQFDLNSNVATKDASVTVSFHQIYFSRLLISDSNIQAAPEMKSIGIQTTFSGKRNSYSELSDKDLQYFTGLERERFIILYRIIEKFEPIEDSLLWSKKDALLITLHKCRHNVDFKMMEFIFEVDRRLISETFKEVIHKMYRVLKQIDIWNMSFSDPKSYRCILDCTEFFVVRAGDL